MPYHYTTCGIIMPRWHIGVCHNTLIPRAHHTYGVMQMPESQTVEREATSIKVKPDLWKDAKIEAIRHGKTVSELVEEAIEAWIKDHRKK